MTMRQQIFTSSFVDKLRLDVKTGTSLFDYLADEISYPAEHILNSTIEVPESKPILGTKPTDDSESAISLYEYLGSLTPTQASDSRLWTYLSHVSFRPYTLERWSVGKVADETKIRNSVIDHWFVSENDRKLRRHSLARLWWAANLTVAPWESDPENFVMLRTDDRYVYTRILLNSQDIFLNVLERGLGRSKKILISLLELFRTDLELATSRERIRNLIKETNLVSGFQKLSALPYTHVQNIVTGLVE